MSDSREVVVWAIGLDRPGIVAAVTGALYEQGCNLEDCSMTILSGNFAMVLVTRTPAGKGPSGPSERGDNAVEELEGALQAAGETVGLTIAVREVQPGTGADDDRPAWMVAVYGADRPGIVHRVSSLLAEEGVNITDLTTRVIGAPDEPVYAMHLEVQLPTGVDPDALGRRLAEVGADLGVETSMHAIEADVF